MSDSATSLDDLVNHFEIRLDKLNKIIRLVHLNQDSSAKKILIKMASDVAIIEGMLYKIRSLIKQKRQDMVELKVLQEELVKVNHSLSHKLANLPTHLLKMRADDTPKDNAPLRERQMNNVKSSQQVPGIPSIEYITVEEFESVPKYIRGRQTYEKVNCAIAELNKAFFQKYKILKCPKSTMNDKTRFKYNQYKEQENNQTKGEYFCVEEDIKAYTSLKMDHHGRATLTVLRHLQRVKEIRGNKLTRYAVVS